MKSINGSVIVGVGLVFGALVASGTAYGAQPPDVVSSDATQNTAMGTGALSNNLGAEAFHSTFTIPLGDFNTAAGYHALFSNYQGNNNTAVGAGALAANGAAVDGGSDAGENTAVGSSALGSNTTGSDNTAAGANSLASNTTGGGNTASGAGALQSNTTGSSNAAFGQYAIYGNTTGIENTAIGFNALSGLYVGNGVSAGNATGSYNTAAGSGALASDGTGSYDTAIGQNALNDNATGNANVAVGVGALGQTVGGSSNDAFGLSALQTNISGSYNIAIGDHAGFYTSGSNNVEIANSGVAGESNTIRIGTANNQKATFVAGIYGTPLTGAAVVVSSTGQLGVVVSSERFKTDIAPMGSKAIKLDQLRPVTFHLKSDTQGPLQYGLIAEEVAKIYPDLVIRDGNGRIDGVRYDELAPILIKRIQEQNQEIAADRARAEGRARTQDAKMERIGRQIEVIQAMLTKSEAALMASR